VNCAERNAICVSHLFIGKQQRHVVNTLNMNANQSSNESELKPIRPEMYTFHAIPGSADRDDKVSIHQIPTGELTAPAGILADVHGSKDDLTVPVYSYLIEKNGQVLLWDLGLMEQEGHRSKCAARFTSQYRGNNIPPRRIWTMLRRKR
jgi:hypothetical protein